MSLKYEYIYPKNVEIYQIQSENTYYQLNGMSLPQFFNYVFDIYFLNYQFIFMKFVLIFGFWSKPVALRLNIALCNCGSDIIDFFGVECSKYYALRPREHELQRTRRDVLSGIQLHVCFFFPLFPFQFRFIWKALWNQGFQTLLLSSGPIKDEYLAQGQNTGVGNQSVNCTISGQPAPSCSHQASWLMGFKAKKRQWREEVCPVVIHIQSGLKLLFFFFKMTFKPLFNINHYD